jgi:hypothetical protein
MEAVSGTAGADVLVAVGLGLAVRLGPAVRLGVGLGVVRVGEGDGLVADEVAVGVRRGPVSVAVGVGAATRLGAPLRAAERVPDGVGDELVGGALVVGAPEARDGVLFDWSSAGIAIPAPKTKNTAAMTNLDHCIASHSSSTRQRVISVSRAHRLILDHSLLRPVLCRLPQRRDGVTVQLCGVSITARPEPA